MNTKLTVIAALLGVSSLLPVAGYAADMANTSAVPSNANETASTTTPKDSHAVAGERSAHPVDDSWITTKIKAKFVADKRVRADNIEVKTLDGNVELFGTASSKTHGKHAAALARQVKGVKTVKNNIEIAPADSTASSDKMSRKERTADARGSDQPVSDSWITTKVKAKLIENKEVKGHNIHVKTLDGVVQLSGMAGSADESSKAAELARAIKGVKSVTNDITVK